MRFILALIFCMFIAGSVLGQETNPRLKNFRYGTGKASWWQNKPSQPAPQPRFQTYYYPPAVRYYQPMPYYGRHFVNCRCHICYQRMMMYQWQINPQRFFFFQFRF